MGLTYGARVAAGGGAGATLETFALGVAVSSPEGNSGTTNHVWTINRAGDTSRTASIDWSVSGTGSNPASASDFVGGTFPFGTVSFAAGETSKTFTVPIQGDTSAESTETYLVTLSNARVNASITIPTATGTLTDDDTVSAFDWASVGTSLVHVIDLTRVDLIYSDLAGTTPISGNLNDVIMSIRDPLSGALYQTDGAGKGFLYDPNAGKPRMKRQGSATRLNLTTLSSLSSPFEWMMGISIVTATNNHRIISTRATDTTKIYYFYLSATGLKLLNGGNDITSTLAPNTPTVVGAFVGNGFTTPSWGAIYHNDVEQTAGQSNTATPGNDTTTGFCFGPGGGFGGSEIMDGWFYSAIFKDGQITGAARTAIHNRLTAITG